MYIAKGRVKKLKIDEIVEIESISWEISDIWPQKKQRILYEL